MSNILKAINEGISTQDLVNVLFHRLENRFPDIVSRYGHEVVGDAIMNVADFHQGAEELGSSDINIMLKEILKQLNRIDENMNQNQEETITYGLYTADKQEPLLKFSDIESLKNRYAMLKKKYPTTDFIAKKTVTITTPIGNPSLLEGLRDPKDNPCWKGYKPVGTKKKNGRTVPNCVPNANEDVVEVNDYFKRRKDEEDRIAGKKSSAKRTPRQTDYEKKRKEQGVAEGTKLVVDGPIINVYDNGTHIGNIFVSKTKDTPYKAYSKHWGLSRLFKSKKAAVDWLSQTHQTAIKEGTHEQGVAEGAEERSQNRLWQMITDYEKRAKATTNDIKKAHYLKMAQELRYKLKTSDEQGVAEGSEDTAAQRKAERDKQRTTSAKKQRDQVQRKGLKQDKDGTYYAKEGVAEGQLNELSTQKLAHYKTAAAQDAKKADSEGNYERGNKRFKGMLKATKKQFDNETSPKKESAILKGLQNETKK